MEKEQSSYRQWGGSVRSGWKRNSQVIDSGVGESGVDEGGTVKL